MDATSRCKSLEAQIAALEPNLKPRQRDVAGALAAVAEAQRAASRDLIKEKEQFTRVKRRTTFLWSSLASGLVILALLAIVSIPRARARWAFHRTLIFGGAGVVLLALYLFQMI
jgi:hypothetical protein